MNRKLLGMIIGLVAGLSLVGAAPAVFADSTAGDIYYTTFSGTDRVFKRSYSYDGVTTLTYGSQITISSTTDGLGGADGLIFDPTNTGFLIVGGQNNDFYRVDANTPHVAVLDSGDASVGVDANIFHVVADSSGTAAWGTDIPGANPVKIALTGAGFGASSFITISGSEPKITGIAFDGAGKAYYTTAPPAGGGNFGTIDLSTGATSQLQPDLPAAHGIQFDPFTGDLILFGDGHITQVATDGTIVSDLDLSDDVQFDQGTVDGKGHLFVASNTGSIMTFLDYRSSRLVGDGSNFLDQTSSGFPANLDDVAPLSGRGSRPPVVPEPTSMLLFGLGGIGTGLVNRRKQSKA